SNSPIITSNPAQLTFTSQVGVNPAAQSLTISSSSTALTYSISGSVTTPLGANWLQVPTQSATASPNSVISVSVNTQGLASGTYTAVINVNAPGAGNPNVAIPVTLNVTPGSVLQLGASSLSFAYQVGQAVQNQAVNVNTTSGQVAF